MPETERFFQIKLKELKMKKIMTIVLSLAVLFAFAGCEAGSIPSYYGKTVDSITLLSAPDYIVGETLNPVDLEFRVVYDDGQEVTRTGAELGLAPTTTQDGKVVISQTVGYELDKEKTFGIVYGTTKPTANGSVTAKAIWTCKITPTAFENVEFTVNTTNAPKEIKGDEKITDLIQAIKAIPVSAEFENGNTKAVTDQAIFGKILESITPEYNADNTQATIKSSLDNVTLSPAWVVKIPETTKLTVKGVTLKYDDEIYSQTPEKDGSDNILWKSLADLEYKIVVTLSDNSTVEKTKDEFKAEYNGDVDFNGFYDAGTYVQAVNKNTISFTATVTCDGYSNSNVSLNGTYAKDYPTAFTAELKSEYAAGAEKQLSAPSTVTVDMFTIKFTEWASGASYDGTVAPASSDDVSIENAKILSGETGTHTVYIYWKDEALREKVNGGDPAKTPENGTTIVPIK